MGKPEQLVTEIATRLGLYERLPLVAPGVSDSELSQRFYVGISPLSRETLLLWMKTRLEGQLEHHITHELQEQKTIVVAELEKIKKDFQDWQKEQRLLMEKYPIIPWTPEDSIEEGSRFECDCCGL